MKATYIQEQGDVDVLTYGELPDPEPGPREVVVRVRASALNHLDIFARSGGNAVSTGGFPRVLGCDMAGEIAAVGPGVERWKGGERVVVDYVVKCETCRYCTIGLHELCERSIRLGVDADGGYAQYIKAPAVNCHAIADRLSFEEAASIPLVYHTAWHCLVTRAQLRSGESLLVVAAGSGVGSAAIQVARHLGARVLATAGSDEKIARAKELGADDGVNYNTDPAFSGRIREMSGGKGVDVVLDSVGESLWDQNFRCLKRGGRLVNCGVTGGHRASLHLGRLFTQGISVLGSGERSRREFVAFMELVNRGELRGVVGKTFPLQEARQAHKAMEDRAFFGKIVLQVP